MSEDAKLVVQIVSVAGTALLALITWIIKVMHEVKRDAREINDAVNHRHRHGEEVPRLFDIVLENHRRAIEVEAVMNGDVKPKINEMHPLVKDLHDWKKGYDGSQLSDAAAVNELLAHVNHLDRKSSQHSDQLRSLHVDADERSRARNRHWPDLNEPNSESDVE